MEHSGPLALASAAMLLQGTEAVDLKVNKENLTNDLCKAYLLFQSILWGFEGCRVQRRESAQAPARQWKAPQDSQKDRGI